MACYYKHGFGVSFVLLLLSLVGSLACVFTTNWIYDGEKGLFKGLIAFKGDCDGCVEWEPRDSLFKFKNRRTRVLDIALILYSIASICCFFSVVIHILILIRSPYKTLTGYVTSVFTSTFVAAICAITALVYGSVAEDRIFDATGASINKIYTFYVACVTCFCLGVACILILCTRCMRRTSITLIV
eukprot:TCONS_00005758-protein